MDVEWFKARKRELGINDQAVADAIGRERSVANRVVNGGVAFDVKYVEGLARVFKVSRNEILRKAGVLDGLPDEENQHTLETNVTPVRMDRASLERARDDLPVYGTALGAGRDIDGVAIEQTTLNRADVTQYVSRPSILNKRPDAYGLYCQGSSMHPALPDGEMIAAAPKMPLSIGDLVVVYLRTQDAEEDNGDTARAVLVKELVRRSTSFVELRQYNPPKDFRIPMSEVIRIDHVLTRKEMMS
jgi:phage repressor protein C with HTH and peptisase S24 domain